MTTHDIRFLILCVMCFLELYHGVTSSFFGIGILLVSDLLGFRYFRSVLLYCKFWREHLFKNSRELFF